MIIPVVGNPAAAALALMIQKGGTLRLRQAELVPMNQFALVVEPSPKNQEILHFKTATQDEVRQILLAQAAAVKSVVDAIASLIEKEAAGPKD